MQSASASTPITNGPPRKKARLADVVQRSEVAESSPNAIGDEEELADGEHVDDGLQAPANGVEVPAGHEEPADRVEEVDAETLGEGAFDGAAVDQTSRPTRETEIIDYLVDEFRSLLERQQARAHEAASRTGVDRLKAIVNAERAKATEEALGDDDPVWEHVRPVTRLLDHLIDRPFTSLDGSRGDERASSRRDARAAYYMREFKFQNLEQLRTTLCAYGAAHPADMPWVLAMLVATEAGEDIGDAIYQCLGNILRDEVLAHLCERILSLLLQSSKGKRRDGPVSLFYGGITIKGDVHSRAEHDAKATMSRITNFEQISRMNVTEHTILELPIRDPAHMAIRTDPSLGRVESVLIDAIGLGLNSARGGWRYEWEAREPLSRLARQAIDPLLRPTPLQADPFLGETTRACFREERAYLDQLREATSLPLGEAISDSGFASQLDAAVRISRTGKGGRVPSVWLFKDNTREEFTGRMDAPFWSAQGARCFQALRRLVSYVVNEPVLRAAVDLDEDAVRTHLAPAFDLWSLLLPGPLLWLAVIFLGRLVRTLRPLVVVSFSHLTASAVAEGWPWKAPEEADLVDESWQGGSPNLKKVGDAIYAQRLGSIVLCAPTGKRDAYLHVSVRDPGNLAYDPILRDLAFSEMFLCLVVAKATELVVAAAAEQLTEPLPDDRVLDWLRERRAEVVAHLEAVGVTEALANAKAALAAKRRVVNRLRRLGSIARIGLKGNGSKLSMEGLMRAAARGGARKAQLKEIVKNARLLDECGLDPDPRRLVPMGLLALSRLTAIHPIFTAKFQKWFLALRDAVSISAVSRTYGGSEEARAKVESNRRRLNDWNRAHCGPSHPNVAHRTLSQSTRVRRERDGLQMRALDATKELAEEVSRGERRPWQEEDNWVVAGWRVAVCSDCGETILASTKNCQHACERTCARRHVTTANFAASLRRLLFAHDVLRYPSLRPTTESLLVAGLVVEPARDVLLRAGAQLPEGLNAQEVTGDIVITSTATDDWKLTCAMDVAILEKANPISAGTSHLRESCWSSKTVGRGTDGVTHVIQVRSGPLYNFTCPFGCGRLVTVSRQKPKPQHVCPNRAGKPTDQPVGEPVTRFLQLPADVARRIWWAERVEMPAPVPDMHRPSLWTA